VRVEAAPLTAVHAPRDFVALAKPRLNLLVVASTLVGYAMADGEALGLLRSAGCCSARARRGRRVRVQPGARARSRRADARTRRAPLPDQRLQPIEGVLFGSVITLAGCC
jgi:heme O synthase-like polyprenyltransferase